MLNNFIVQNVCLSLNLHTLIGSAWEWGRSTQGTSLVLIGYCGHGIMKALSDLVAHFMPCFSHLKKKINNYIAFLFKLRKKDEDPRMRFVL